jgi:alcohol dehydrogenase
MNRGAVITNEATTEKSFVQAECLFPKLALVDPELTLSVPPDHTAYGVADLLTHVTEGYFNGVDETPLQDRFAEAVIQTAMEWGPKAVANGRDLEARSQVQWASVVALNGWVQVGVMAPYPVHAIEHVLSAHHDVAHGAGLAVVSPAWMRAAARARPAKFVQFAERIFGLHAKGPQDLEAALAGVDRYEAFLESLGCPTRLSQLEIGREKLARYAEDAVRVTHDKEGRLPGRPPLTQPEVLALLEAAA